jgi:hypothetical protein
MQRGAEQDRAFILLAVARMRLIVAPDRAVGLVGSLWPLLRRPGSLA